MWNPSRRSPQHHDAFPLGGGSRHWQLAQLRRWRSRSVISVGEIRSEDARIRADENSARVRCHQRQRRRTSSMQVAGNTIIWFPGGTATEENRLGHRHRELSRRSPGGNTRGRSPDRKPFESTRNRRRGVLSMESLHSKTASSSPSVSRCVLTGQACGRHASQPAPSRLGEFTKPKIFRVAKRSQDTRGAFSAGEASSEAIQAAAERCVIRLRNPAW